MKLDLDFANPHHALVGAIIGGIGICAGMLMGSWLRTQEPVLGCAVIAGLIVASLVLHFGPRFKKEK